MANGNPFFVQPADYSQGINQLSGALGNYAKVQQQKEAQQQQQQLGQQAAELYKSGTPDEIAQFSIQNPNFGKAISQQLAFKDAETEENFKKSAREILSRPSDTEQILTDRINVLKAKGADPSHTIEELNRFRANPEGHLMATEMAYAALDPKGHQAYKSIRGEPMTEYQAAMMESKKVDQELKRAEIENKKLEFQLKKETDSLKRQELEDKISANKQKASKASDAVNQAAVDAYSSGDDTLKLIRSIEQHPGFSDYVGAKGASSLFGFKDEPVAGSDAAGVAGMIETLSSQNFMNSIQQMKGMGALSDAEGKKVASAVSSLNPNMSEEAFKKSLNTIRNITKRGMDKSKRIMDKKGVDVRAPKPTESAGLPSGNFSSLWGG